MNASPILGVFCYVDQFPAAFRYVDRLKSICWRKLADRVKSV